MIADKNSIFIFFFLIKHPLFVWNLSLLSDKISLIYKLLDLADAASLLVPVFACGFMMFSSMQAVMGIRFVIDRDECFALTRSSMMVTRFMQVTLIKLKETSAKSRILNAAAVHSFQA
ncbi:hypothetical protein SAY86_011048 [Trapa natans]|uniref:Uncharacterized protein n=1 Tax=Trapa natans TaxID=22666 RepID=A0AAN7LKI8_TRANT|nr:hypothetical protein SAY86_011048 [Trapa natans]